MLMLIITLLGVSAVAVVAFAQMRHARAQNKVLSLIKRVAFVICERKCGNVARMYIGGEGFNSNLAPVLRTFSHLRELQLDFTGLEEEDFKVLQDLPRLQQLWIDHPVFSDLAISHLSKLHGLQLLKIRTHGVSSDESLRQLTNLQNLQYLILTGRTIDSTLLRQLHDQLPKCDLILQ
jgi:hypothetical protein